MDTPRRSICGLGSAGLGRGVTLLAVAALALFAGCGRRDMGQVMGRVTFGGRPVPDAVVSFRPKNRPMAVGKTDADGRFVLNTFRKGDGSFFGACQVTVGPFVEGTDQPPAPTSRSPTEDPRPDIPLIYRSPATTPLTAEVVAGKKNVIDFKLD